MAGPATALSLSPSQTIADLDSATPANRKVSLTNWPSTMPTAFVSIHNASDAPVFLCPAAVDTVSGCSVPAGVSAPFGPFAREPDGDALWLYGVGTGSAYVTFVKVNSEGI